MHSEIERERENGTHTCMAFWMGWKFISVNWVSRWLVLRREFGQGWEGGGEFGEGKEGDVDKGAERKSRWTNDELNKCVHGSCVGCKDCPKQRQY